MGKNKRVIDPGKKPTAREQQSDAFDALNRAFVEAEDRIKSLDLGVEGFVELYPMDSDGYRENSNLLSFRKSGLGWYLYIVDPTGDLTPIRSANKADKIRAAHRLPALVEALSRIAQEGIRPILEAETQIRQFLSAPLDKP